MLESFPFAAAMGPLSAYLIVLGWMRLRKPIWIIGGGRDLIALAFGLMGFVAIGPLDLFFPRPAVLWLGRYVWVFLLLLYWLLVFWLVLNMRPRLILYGISAEQLRTCLDEIVSRVDRSGEVSDIALWSPSLGIEAYIESSPRSGVCQLIAVSNQQSMSGWKLLELSLADATRSLSMHRFGGLVPKGAPLVMFGSGLFLLCITLAILLVQPAQTVAQAVHFLRG